MTFSGFDLDAFLGLHRLVQPIRPAPPGHQAAGELVHDDDLAGLHQIILVAFEEELGAQSLFQVAQQAGLLGGDVFGAVGVAQRLAEQLFDVDLADLGQGDGAVLLVDLVIFGLQLAHDLAMRAYHSVSSEAGPEMISGVRASSIRTLSTSSTMA